MAHHVCHCCSRYRGGEWRVRPRGGPPVPVAAEDTRRSVRDHVTRRRPLRGGRGRPRSWRRGPAATAWRAAMHALPPRVVATHSSAALRGRVDWRGRSRCGGGWGGDSWRRWRPPRLLAGDRARQCDGGGGGHVALRGDCMGGCTRWLRVGPQYGHVSACQLLNAFGRRNRGPSARHSRAGWSRVVKKEACTVSPLSTHVLRCRGDTQKGARPKKNAVLHTAQSGMNQ